MSVLGLSGLRCSVTYVDQSGGVFDASLLENMLYGCGSEKMLLGGVELNRMMRSLSLSGSSLMLKSGGERQLMNVISGLMQGSKILILDEPTNALDPDVKKELLQLIVEYKEKKECIIIISHDKDVFPLFDETINVGE